MDRLMLRGRVRLRVWQDGQVVEVREGENLIVVDGFYLAAALIAGEAVNAISHMAAGDSASEPSLQDSDLQGTEQARVTVTTSRTENEITYTADFSSIGSDIEVNEFGLFNAASGGDMLARFTTSTFTLFSGQSMDIDWSIEVGQ